MSYNCFLLIILPVNYMVPIQKTQYNEATLHSAAETFYALQKTFSEAAYNPNTSQADLTKLKGRFDAAWNEMKKQIIGNLDMIVETRLIRSTDYGWGVCSADDVAKIKKMLADTKSYLFEKKPENHESRQFVSDTIILSVKSKTGTEMPIINFYAPDRFNQPGENEKLRFGGIYFYAVPDVINNSEPEGFRKVFLPKRDILEEGEPSFRRVDLPNLIPQKKK